MDSQARTAILAILKAHTQMRADYHAALRLLQAIKRAAPHVFSMPQVLQVAEKILNSEEEDMVGRLEDALKGNQAFAALLQEYAARPEVPLADHIQILKQAGFQVHVD